MDRLTEMQEVLARARQVFTWDGANAWFLGSNRHLDGKAPIEVDKDTALSLIDAISEGVIF